MGRKNIIIVGATATGKTSVADEICAVIGGGEIISADSRQVYKRLDIGTNRTPTRARQHLVSFLEPDENFSAHDFYIAASAAQRDITSRGKTPVISGGTGLYIKTLFDGGLDSLPRADELLRAKLGELSAAELYERLIAVDASSAEKNRGNPQRLARALEIFEITGVSMSEHLASSAARRKDTALSRENFRAGCYCAGLFLDRAVLRARIEERSGRMIKDGMIEETLSAVADGYPRSAAAFTGIGYRAVFDFLDGKIDRERLVVSLSADTAKYAKRQSTWFRTQTPPDKWYDAALPPSELAARIIADAG